MSTITDNGQASVNSLTDLLAKAESRFQTIEKNISHISEHLKIDLHKEAKPEEKQLETSEPILKKVKPIVEKITGFVKDLFGQLNKSSEADLEAIVGKMTEFNKQTDSYIYSDFLNKTVAGEDQARYVSAHDDFSKLLSLLVGKLTVLECKPEDPEVISFMKNIFTLFLDGKLNDEDFSHNLEDEKIQEYLGELDGYFSSEGKALGLSLTETLRENEFEKNAGLLILLTYISAHLLAKEKGTDIKEALELRFNSLSDLCEKYRPHHDVRDVNSELIKPLGEALKFIDEFMESGEARLDFFERDDSVERLQIIGDKPMNVCELAVKSLLDWNRISGNQSGSGRGESLSFEEKYKHVIRQVLTVLLFERISKEKVDKLYDWMNDGNPAAKDDRMNLMISWNRVKADTDDQEEWKKVKDNWAEIATQIVEDSLIEDSDHSISKVDVSKLSELEVLCEVLHSE